MSWKSKKKIPVISSLILFIVQYGKFLFFLYSLLCLLPIVTFLWFGHTLILIVKPPKLAEIKNAW